jgi:hypothetical protein
VIVVVVVEAVVMVVVGRGRVPNVDMLSLFTFGVKDLLGDRQRRVSETWSVYRCLTLGKVPVGYGFFALKSTVGRCVNLHMVEITCEDATSCLTVCTFSVVLLPLFT